MSQIIRATFVSPARHGISWNVSGSGIATMSDSSIALKPVIDEPSKPIPSSSASSISLGVTAKLFRWPSMSVNQRRTNSTSSSCSRASTFRRDSGSDVARFSVSTCAMGNLLENANSPRREPHARGCVASNDGVESTRSNLDLRAGRPRQRPVSLWTMRVLVTGGAGFIGSHFVRRLAAAGDDVVVLDKLTYSGNPANLEGVDHEFHEGDIADAEAVEPAARGCDAIVNFAAETHVDRSILGAAEFIQTDVLGTYVLLRHAAAERLRFVQVSTDEVYGDVPPGESSREDDQLHPSSPYSASKAGGDLQVVAAVRTYGVNASITRGSNTYGPYQYPEKILPLFVTNALDGEALPLYGDGRQVRDWLHAEDHCAGIDLVLREGSPGHVYNVGAGDERENVELTGRILEFTGADPGLVRHVEDRAGHDRRYSLDTT